MDTEKEIKDLWIVNWLHIVGLAMVVTLLIFMLSRMTTRLETVEIKLKQLQTQPIK